MSATQCLAKTNTFFYLDSATGKHQNLSLGPNHYLEVLLPGSRRDGPRCALTATPGQGKRVLPTLARLLHDPHHRPDPVSHRTVRGLTTCCLACCFLRAVSCVLAHSPRRARSTAAPPHGVSPSPSPHSPPSSGSWTPPVQPARLHQWGWQGLKVHSRRLSTQGRRGLTPPSHRPVGPALPARRGPRGPRPRGADPQEPIHGRHWGCTGRPTEQQAFISSFWRLRA